MPLVRSKSSRANLNDNTPTTGRLLDVPEPFRSKTAQSIKAVFNLPPAYSDEDALLYYWTLFMGH
jgi:hypothetical protein